MMNTSTVSMMKKQERKFKGYKDICEEILLNFLTQLKLADKKNFVQLFESC